MTTQEKINELANRALRSGPPPAARPKPATYMPTFEELKSPLFGSSPMTLPAAAPAPAAKAPENPVAATPEPAPAIPAPADEPDTELRSMIESRDEQIIKKRSRTSLAVTCALLALVAGSGTWIAVSPTARSNAGALVSALKQGGRDMKGLASIMGTYDQQLEQVSVHGSRIDEASKALGADPAVELSSDDGGIEAAMKDMSGGEGPTTAERDELLKQKFGVVAKIARRDTGKPAVESDVKF